MRTKRKILVSSLLGVALACSVTGVGSVIANKAVAEPVMSEVQFEETYAFGKKISLPEATITADGKTYETETVVCYPNGVTYKTSEVELNVEGVYTVYYRAVINGKLNFFEKNFTVVKNLYTVLKDNSTVEYGTYDAEKHDPNNEGSVGTVQGVKIALSEGDVFTYGKAIDVSSWQMDDQLISMAITPEVIGVYDVSNFDIIFTDAYDSSNTVTVNVNASPDGVRVQNSYIKVNTAGQSPTGMEWNFNKLHIADNFGYPVRMSFAGLKNADHKLNTISDNSINISFDYAEKEVHSTIRQASTTSTVIADLDSLAYFSKPWGGFTTGECFVSVRANAYVNGVFNFILTKVGNDVLTNLSESEISNLQNFVTADPYINVDLQGYTETSVPHGVVGEKYKLFNATCVSPYFGKLSVSTKVVSGYGTENEYEVPVKNGYFTPTENKPYSIVYVVTDLYGKSVEKAITVNVQNSANEIVFDPSTLNFATTGVAGNVMSFEYPVANGGSGMITVDAFIEFGGERSKIDNSYRFPKAGEYKLVFVATDYNGQTKEYAHSVTVSAGEYPVFIDEPVLPRYFISGVDYVIPKVVAYNYTDGSVSEIVAEAIITDADSTKRVKNNTVTPVVHKNGAKVSITYRATINGKTSSLTYEIPTIVLTVEDDFLALDRLIYSEDVSVVVPEEYDTIYTTVKDNTRLDYINPLVANGLEFKFNPVKVNCNYSAISIILTDTEDASQSVKYTYRKNGTGTIFYVNDNTMETYKVNQSFVKGDEFTFKFDAVANNVSFDSSVKTALNIKNTVYGETFKGYESRKVWMTVVLEGVEGVSEIAIVSVNNQFVCYDSMEFVPPRIAIMGTYGGMMKFGNTVLLPAAMVSDAVDPNATALLSVTAPDGTYARTVDGVMLKNVDCTKEYEIKIDQIGAYTVSYEGEDASGNTTKTNYIINVPDEAKPTIKVEGKVNTEYTLGETIKLPKATVTDNFDNNLQVRIYVTTEKGKTVVLKDRAFKPLTAGKYVVRYWAMDTAGNISSVNYVITVK